jgi:hypothetical protein
MRNICKVTFLLLFLFTSSFSQEIEWQNTIGGSLCDRFNQFSETQMEDIFWVDILAQMFLVIKQKTALEGMIIG